MDDFSLQIYGERIPEAKARECAMRWFGHGNKGELIAVHPAIRPHESKYLSQLYYSKEWVAVGAFYNTPGDPSSGLGEPQWYWCLVPLQRHAPKITADMRVGCYGGGLFVRGTCVGILENFGE